jgi:hypothetical protein
MTKRPAEMEIEMIRSIAAWLRDNAPKEGGARKVAAAAKASAGEADKLCKLAQAGDKDADAGLCMAASFLIKKGEPLPGSMAKYISDILLMRGGHGGHQRSNANQQRDILILQAVHKLAKLGWLPTRNRETQDAESACSIVQKGLALAGENLSESRVEDIWREQTKWWES